MATNMITVKYNGQDYFFREGTPLSEIKESMLQHVGGLDNNARLQQDPNNASVYTLVPGPQTKG
jgi:uncharacterized membrane-anchored protein